MAEEFEDRVAAHVHRDSQGVVRYLLHPDEPYVSGTRTPQFAARTMPFGPYMPPSGRV